jgi:hypothetical protein
MAHAAGIEMHERRAGSGIKAYAAALSAQPGRPQLIERHSGDVEIDRLAEHMLTELGNSVRALAQRRVRGRRAVSTDDPDRRFGSEFVMDLPQKIDQVGVHLGRLILPPVAQKVVDLFQCILVVAAVHLVSDGEVFVGVHMVKRNCARFAVRRGGPQRLAAEDNEKSRQAAAITGPGQTQVPATVRRCHVCQCHVCQPMSCVPA